MEKRPFEDAGGSGSHASETAGLFVRETRRPSERRTQGRVGVRAEQTARAGVRQPLVGEGEDPLARPSSRTIWARCTLRARTPAVCDFARAVQPAQPLRILDALHLAPWPLVRRWLGEDVPLVASDARLKAASLRM